LVLDVEKVGLAADLAIFDVVLPPSRGFVDRGQVPLAAAGALKTRFHAKTHAP